MRRAALAVLFLFGAHIVQAQTLPISGSSSSGSGSGTINSGTSGDVECSAGGTTVGPCDTGVATYIGGVLTAPSVTTTGAASVSTFNAGINYCLDAVGTDAYACTITGLAAYTTGAVYWVKHATANTGAATLELTSLTAKNIKVTWGAAQADPPDNCIRANDVKAYMYDGTSMVMLSPCSSAISGSGFTTARDNLDDGGSGNLDYSPLDTTTIILRDEFSGGNATSGSVGDMGWVLSNMGAGTCAPGFAAGVFPNLGLAFVGTGANSDDSCSATFGTTSARPFGDLAANTNWEAIFIAKVDTITSVKVWIGLFGATGLPSADGWWARFDAATDTNWQLCGQTTGGGEVCTATDSGVAVNNTSYFKIRIRSTTAGTVLLSVNGGTEQSLCAASCGGTLTATAVSLRPIFAVQTKTTAQRAVTVDFFAFKMRGTSR